MVGAVLGAEDKSVSTTGRKTSLFTELMKRMNKHSVGY